jgi:prepilin-type N-terminal cleavage/methylation domain-containing protein/prepilin-type processing-associated H-X9-DG protein
MHKKGFTLIELRVVSAIIAILAAILFPVFARARAKAEQTSCLSNAKQMMLAALMYEQDWGIIPPRCLWIDENDPYADPAHFGWYAGGYYLAMPDLLQPYIRNVYMLICPTYGRHYGEWQAYGYASTYQQNGLHFRHWSDGWELWNPGLSYDGPCTNNWYNTCACTGYKKFTQVPRPAESMFIGEANDATSWSWGVALYCPMCQGNMWWLNGERAENQAWGICTARHMKGGNFAHCDGHAHWQPYARICKNIFGGASDKEKMWCKAFWAHGNADDPDPCV